METKLKKRFSYKPLTVQNWTDFETVMGEKGGSAGCWCMWNRLEKREFEEGKGETNKCRMKELVKEKVTGIILYYEDEPVGWLSIIERNEAVIFNRSKVLERVDDLPVVSISCIYTRKKYTGKGIAEELLKAVIEYAHKTGVAVLEGYPIDTQGKKTISNFVYTGFYSTYVKVGFEEVARRSESKPIMRYYIKGKH